MATYTSLRPSVFVHELTEDEIFKAYKDDPESKDMWGKATIVHSAADNCAASGQAQTPIS